MPRFDKLEFNEPSRRPPGGDEADRVLRQRPDWLARADENRRGGLYENALRCYSRGLEENRSLVGGWLGQVQMLVLLGELPEAELWARKALELFPSHGDLMAGRAQAFCRMGNKKQAYALCDGALQQAGQSAYRWTVRGEIMLANRQDVDRHCFDKALGLDPDWLVPLEIALACLYYGKAGKALPFAQRAVESAPDQHYAWHVQGLCQQQLGMNSAARKSFERCLELCPRHSEAASRLAEVKMPGFPLGRILRRLFGRT